MLSAARNLCGGRVRLPGVACPACVVWRFAFAFPLFEREMVMRICMFGAHHILWSARAPACRGWCVSARVAASDYAFFVFALSVSVSPTSDVRNPINHEPTPNGGRIIICAGERRRVVYTLVASRYIVIHTYTDRE